MLPAPLKNPEPCERLPKNLRRAGQELKVDVGQKEQEEHPDG